MQGLTKLGAETFVPSVTAKPFEEDDLLEEQLDAVREFWQEKLSREESFEVSGYKISDGSLFHRCLFTPSARSEFDFQLTYVDSDGVPFGHYDITKRDIEKSLEGQYNELFIRLPNTTESIVYKLKFANIEKEGVGNNMDRREMFKESLVELLEEDETMAEGQPDEVIYQIDDITVYGGFDCGIRGVDQRGLIPSDDITWEDMIEWGTLVVPETQTYISDVPIDQFEELGFSNMPTNGNQFVGFKEEAEVEDEEPEVDNQRELAKRKAHLARGLER